MDFNNPGASISVPDGVDPALALDRTTHLAVGSHQDDIPIMAYDGILRCYGRDDQWFLGVTVTDGAGSPRSGPFAGHTDDQMREVRHNEETAAAAIGEYSAVIQLDYSSSAVRSPGATAVVEEIARVIAAAEPDVVYTHNLADKHDTHVATAVRTIEALRSLPARSRPSSVFGCEVWRDLDWMVDADKVLFDVSAHRSLWGPLIGVYESQLAGGKRYDLATEGRRQAHATFSESHQVDAAERLILGMDLTPLMVDSTIDPADYAAAHIDRTRHDIVARINRFR